jgi:diguanylate cyclase (GGDEF)-like protein
MEERLKLMQQKYSLNNSLFSVVLADLDHLKVINDQYGRDTGDKVLQITSALLNNELREDDLVARWSGNQFILLCSDVGLEKAAKIAESLR